MTIDLTYFLSLFVATLIFAILAPIVGCLLNGLDRKISAKMQGRIGPPVLQPFYDFMKLLAKERSSINSSESVYVIMSLIFAILAGGIFFSGGNLLLCIFVITLSSLMYIMAGCCSRSIYADVGSAREILQVMSYEPAILIFATCIIISLSKSGIDIANSGNVSALLECKEPLIATCWASFIGLIYVLTIKLRKSPFDLSSSSHAHQELVSGITTEMTGRTLAIVELTHWVESVLFLSWAAIFFIYSSPASIAVAIVVAIVIWFLEILIDNNAARVKWQLMLKSAWIVALFAGVINMAFLAFI